MINVLLPLELLRNRQLFNVNLNKKHSSAKTCNARTYRHRCTHTVYGAHADNYIAIPMHRYVHTRQRIHLPAHAHAQTKTVIFRPRSTSRVKM